MEIKALEIETELVGIMKEFRETIRELRMERAAMEIALQKIAYDPWSDAHKLARETLARLAYKQQEAEND